MWRGDPATIVTATLYVAVMIGSVTWAIRATRREAVDTVGKEIEERFAQAKNTLKKDFRQTLDETKAKDLPRDDSGIGIYR